MNQRSAAGVRRGLPRGLLRGLAQAGVVAVLAGIALPATAQDAAPPTGDAPAAAARPDLTGPIAFEADQVSYAYDPEVVTASGNVVLRRADQSVRADTVTWDRRSGRIVATGNIRLVDADGNQLYTDQVELTDELKAGAMQNLLIALRDGGRLAAVTGERDPAGHIILSTPAIRAARSRTSRAARATRPGRSSRGAWSTCRTSARSASAARACASSA